jgi:hypothetical protein
MSDYLRSLDPFGHLITTSFWSNTGPDAFWQLPNIDIVQTHCYTNDDGNVALPVREFGLHQWRSYQKPHLFGEFGIRSGAGTEEMDPEGWALHNALWSGLFSFCAGGPMPWWHENWIDPLNLYFHFTAIANFTAGLPLGRPDLHDRPIDIRADVHRLGRGADHHLAGHLRHRLDGPIRRRPRGAPSSNWAAATPSRLPA